jgi:peptidoglycan/LPS O-acetylase OafA/YrhL
MDRSEAAPSPRPRYQALTGIRGILALWIVLFHISVGLSVSGTPMDILFGDLWVHLMGAADIAVYGFFMLSGFLMAHLYAARFAEPSLRWRTALGFWGGAWPRSIRCISQSSLATF